VTVNGEPSPGAFILVVEDNPANQLLIQFTLESSGYHVDVAGSAREALAIIDRRMPNLILMDIQLPGQDGLSLTRQLKAAPAMKAIPVVALTARAMVGDRELCLAAGCSGYISKPIDTRTIADEIARFLSAAK
jgi:two-component system, cell cycle response regulator DivK